MGATNTLLPSFEYIRSVLIEPVFTTTSTRRKNLWFFFFNNKNKLLCIKAYLLCRRYYHASQPPSGHGVIRFFFYNLQNKEKTVARCTWLSKTCNNNNNYVLHMNKEINLFFSILFNQYVSSAHFFFVIKKRSFLFFFQKIKNLKKQNVYNVNCRG